jgi:hypothetical protein
VDALDVPRETGAGIPGIDNTLTRLFSACMQSILQAGTPPADRVITKRRESMYGLEGIRIISFNHFFMGPVGIQYLADLGADVIAIEPLNGAFQRKWG